MSEHEPDPAALDELSRAFGGEPMTHDESRPVAPEPDDELDATEHSFGADRDADVTPSDADPRDAAPIDEFEPTAPVAVQAPPVPPQRPTIRIGGDDIPELAGSRPTAPPPRASSTGGPVVIPIGGDDDLPDAVYLEGDLVGGRGTVVIEDDASGDVVRTETARDLRRGVEPRLRERRAAVHRAKVRKRLLWIGLGIGTVVVIVAALAVLGSGLFAVKQDSVRMTGNVYTDPARLDEIVADLVGTPTLVADEAEFVRRIEEIPWVESARVSVSFPHSATIEIRERKALTTYQGPDQRYRVLDREGRVLDVLDKHPIAYLQIKGPDAVDLEPGQFAPFGYTAASELALTLTPGLRGQVSAIGVTADGASLALLMKSGVEVRFGEARYLLEKLVRLETVLAEVAREQAEAQASGDPLPELPAVIDVSTRETTR